MPPAAPDHVARDLVAALRAELAAVEPTRACDRAAERAGLGAAATGRAPSAVVARLAVRLGRRGGPRARGGAGGREGDGAPPTTPAGRALTTLAGLADAAFEWSDAADHCRYAWLRGRFLARGSLSLAGGRTHLELVVPAAEAPVLAARLAQVGLPASWRLRRGDGVVTWKSAETVLRFLQAAGATAALLELEARLVTRSLHGQLNRVLNAETANLERAVAAAARQRAAIAELDADGRLAHQPPEVRAVARVRRDLPEATLTELAERAGVSRSIAQRALLRIESLALHAAEGPRRR